MASLATVALVATAVGGAYSTYAGYRQNRFQKKLYEQNARKSQEDAAAREGMARRDQKRQMAAARARYGAAGVQMAGTPLSVLGDLAAQAEEQALLIRYGGASQATNDMARARSAGAAATGSIISGTTQTLGSTVSQANSNYQTYGSAWPGFG